MGRGALPAQMRLAVIYLSMSNVLVPSSDKPAAVSVMLVPFPLVESCVELTDDVSKTTAIINLKGSVDVMVSPLMLEALQR